MFACMYVHTYVCIYSHAAVNVELVQSQMFSVQIYAHRHVRTYTGTCMCAHINAQASRVTMYLNTMFTLHFTKIPKQRQYSCVSMQTLAY